MVTNAFLVIQLAKHVMEINQTIVLIAEMDTTCLLEVEVAFHAPLLVLHAQEAHLHALLALHMNICQTENAIHAMHHVKFVKAHRQIALNVLKINTCIKEAAIHHVKNSEKAMELL